MVESVCFGEVLWDILPGGALPGGAPMNVAFHLNRLGISTEMISKVGEDDHGKGLLEFMQRNGIPTTLIQKDSVQPTATVLATPGANFEMQYDIVKPVAYDFINVTSEAAEAVSEATFFIFGSLASRTEHTRNTLQRLLSLANKKVFDINLRPPHYIQEVVETLLQQADIVKMNEYELELVSAFHADISIFEDKVRLICDRYQISGIIITKGADGACYYDGEYFYEHPGFKVQVADTIGSGDAFLAGFLSRVIKEKPPQECVEFACKLGAFVATQEGACPDYDVQQVEALIA